MAPLSTSIGAPLTASATPVSPISGLIAGASATPSPVPNGAASVTGGGAVGGSGTGGLQAAQLASVLALVTTLIGILTAQQGANATPSNLTGSSLGGVSGGGGRPTETTTPIGGDVSVTTSSSIIGPSNVGGPSTPNPNGWEIVTPVVAGTPASAASASSTATGASGGGAVGPATGTSVIGGGSIGVAGQQAVNTALAATGVATVGGGPAGNGWTIVDATGAAISSATAMGANAAPVSNVAGGGATATPAGATGSPTVEPDAPAGTQIDMRRVAGTPAAGGVIQTIISATSISAMPAMSEGTWLVLTDENGARMQVHAHGRWATATNAQIVAGIQSKQISVHLHADGTVHLHDSM